jgi:hypothetical protein
MTVRIVPEIERPITQRSERRHPLDPHLVCMWKIDPVSQRRCCVWTAPSETARPKAAERLRLVVG